MYSALPSVYIVHVTTDFYFQERMRASTVVLTGPESRVHEASAGPPKKETRTGDVFARPTATNPEVTSYIRAITTEPSAQQQEADSRPAALTQCRGCSAHPVGAGPPAEFRCPRLDARSSRLTISPVRFYVCLFFSHPIY